MEKRKMCPSAIVASALFLGLGAITLPGMAQTNDPIPEVEPGANGSPLPEDVRFECQLHNGQYTVMYLPENRPGQAYPWATPGSMGGGWSAERRCFTISERLESYRPEGLAELQTGTENGYDIVCATTEQVPGLCKIVFTVPPGQDPVMTRDLVFENLTLADGGTDTTVVTTFTGSADSGLYGELGNILDGSLMDVLAPEPSSSGIDLKPFLSPADGGTGEALTQPAASGRPLNPDNFR